MEIVLQISLYISKFICYDEIRIVEADVVDKSLLVGNIIEIQTRHMDHKNHASPLKTITVEGKNSKVGVHQTDIGGHKASTAMKRLREDRGAWRPAASHYTE